MKALSRAAGMGRRAVVPELLKLWSRGLRAQSLTSQRGCMLTACQGVSVSEVEGLGTR